jgi:tryptophan synthase beta chain
MGDDGRFGRFGGAYVAETLTEALRELTAAYRRAQGDPAFLHELERSLAEFAGRATPLTFCTNLSAITGSRLYLKREDLLHGGAHKINNTLGQALLARSMGKRRIIAETGAGQHGVATAIAGAALGIPVEVYMGEEDVRRQHLNVVRMEMLGARVVPVATGTRTLKDAVSEAMRAWIADVNDAYYLMGSVVGPHPYPTMVRDFQTVIGRETRRQIRAREGRLPDAVVACVGGGSNAIGMFHPFLGDDVALFGAEAGGCGIACGQHGASLSAGTPGVLHGMLSYLLQDGHGQITDTHSIAAGLDYPGVGPEHSMLRECGRVRYDTVTDREALDAFRMLAKHEGIIPALESAHAVAYALRLAKTRDREEIIVINLSGRGDKDVADVAAMAEGA